MYVLSNTILLYNIVTDETLAYFVSGHFELFPHATIRYGKTRCGRFIMELYDITTENHT